MSTMRRKPANRLPTASRTRGVAGVAYENRLRSARCVFRRHAKNATSSSPPAMATCSPLTICRIYRFGSLMLYAGWRAAEASPFASSTRTEMKCCCRLPVR